MFAGRIFHYDKLQIQCGYNAASFSIHQDEIGLNATTIQVSTRAVYDTEAIGPTSKFRMSVAANVSYTDDVGGIGSPSPTPHTLISQGITYTLHWFASTFTHTDATFVPSASCYVEFINFEVWVTDSGTWLTKWDSAAWYLGDGTLLQALTPGSVTSDAGIEPSNIPIFNGTLDIGGAANTDFESSFDNNWKAGSGSNNTYNIDTTITAGWRGTVDAGVTWITPEVHWQDSRIGGSGTTWSPNIILTRHGTETLTDLGPSGGNYIIRSNINLAISGFTNLRMIPTWTRKTLRTIQNHECPVEWFPFDNYRFESSVVTRILPSAPPSPVISYINTYPSRADVKEMEKDGAGTAETSSTPATIYSYADVLYETKVSYFDTTITAGEHASTEWPIVPASETGTDVVSELTGPLLNGSSHIMPYLTSTDAVFQYYNTWAHPNWSSFIMTGPQHLETLGAEPWYLCDESGNPAPQYYWLLQQTYDQDALPIGQRTEHRADQIIPPLNSRGLGGLLDGIQGFTSGTNNVLNVGGYWWGNTGQVWIKPTPIASALLGTASAGRWRFYDHAGGSIVAGGSVTDSLYTFPATANVAEFNMGDWSSFPFGYLAICNKLMVVDLPATPNVDSWKIEIVGEDGAHVEIASTIGTFPFQQANNSKWSVSAILDFGAGTITDSYASALANDDSATVYLDSQIAATTEKISAWAGAKIRITLVKTTPGSTAKFSPVTVYAGTSMKVVPLSARDSVLYIENGPSLLIGPQVFWTALTGLLDVPGVAGTYDGQMSAGDLAALYVSVFLAQQPTVHLHAFLAQYFVYGTSGEIEWSVISHFWQDPFTQSQLTTGFMLGPYPVFVLNNSYRNLPPLAMMLNNSRTNVEHWGPGHDQGMYGFSDGNTRRYVVSPAGVDSVTLIAPPVAAQHPNANCLVVDSGDAMAGWSVQYMLDKVSNDEPITGTNAYKLKTTRPDTYASYRPWRGIVFIPFWFIPGTPGIGTHMISSALRFFHFVGTRPSGDVFCKTFSLGGISSEVTILNDSDAKNPQVAWITNQQLVVAFEKLGDTYLVYSADFGLTWGSPFKVVSGGTHPALASNNDGALYLATWAGGTWTLYRQRKNEALTSLGTLVSASESRGAMICNRHSNGMMAFATETQLYESGDGGQSWGATASGAWHDVNLAFDDLSGGIALVYWDGSAAIKSWWRLGEGLAGIAGGTVVGSLGTEVVAAIAVHTGEPHSVVCMVPDPATGEPVRYMAPKPGETWTPG